jgi:hypothetical protein
MTGGHVRDTLAGLFDDRAARRFAYRSLVPPLLVFAAIAMLLAVTARRVGVSDAAMALAHRLTAWRAATAVREAERNAELARQQALAIREQERLRDVIKSKREREAHAVPGGLPVVPLAPRREAPEVAAVPPVTTAPLPRPPAQAPAPVERPLTAAEKLALRRRERR